MDERRGFTLTELAIAAAIMAILAAITVPRMGPFLAQRRLSGAARQVMIDLLSARMQAVKNNGNVAVTFLNNHSYSILNDANNNGTADAGEVLITRDIRPDYYDIGFSSNTNPVFRANGMPLPGTNGTVTLTGMAGTKQVIINSAGRVRIN
ncbi:MAG: GspH/FimT family protein [Smithellaceae bacterium]|nr:GspH/FimT family protein [Smithellaceae bacterium]